jgi:hypothetical protein
MFFKKKIRIVRYMSPIEDIVNNEVGLKFLKFSFTVFIVGPKQN